jgi:hypothetical protein
MKKYRIKKSKKLLQWQGRYSANDFFYVQQKFFWFFWITIMGFQEEHLAFRFMQAKIELDENKPEIL